MANRAVGSTSIRLKGEDITLDLMKFILNNPYNLHVNRDGISQICYTVGRVKLVRQENAVH